jgi:hypothetical protein
VCNQARVLLRDDEHCNLLSTFCRNLSKLYTLGMASGSVVMLASCHAELMTEPAVRARQQMLRPGMR